MGNFWKVNYRLCGPHHPSPSSLTSWNNFRDDVANSRLPVAGPALLPPSPPTHRLHHTLATKGNKKINYSYGSNMIQTFQFKQSTRHTSTVTNTHQTILRVQLWLGILSHFLLLFQYSLPTRSLYHSFRSLFPFCLSLLLSCCVPQITEPTFSTNWMLLSITKSLKTLFIRVSVPLVSWTNVSTCFSISWVRWTILWENSFR